MVGGIAFSMIHWSNTAPTPEVTDRRSGPAQIAANPVATPFKRARSEGALKVAAQFVDTAVRRRHVERSYDLVTPTFRAGYSRGAWAKTDIPVQPFPLEYARYQLKGSFVDHVWLQVAVYPDKAHRQVPAAVFDLVLRPFSRGGDRHWLVDSWAPAGYLQIPEGPLLAARDKQGRPLPAATVEWKSELSQRWLLVPVSVFGVALLSVLFVILRGVVRDRRALKRYQATYR